MQLSSSDPSWMFLDAAAEGSLERIRNHGRSAPTKARPLFEYLESHLFDRDLSIEAIKGATAWRCHAAAVRFLRVEEGVTLQAYIARCRLETASVLLFHHELGMEQIARLVGFSSAHSFRTAFKRHFRQRPSDFRKALRQAPDHPSTLGLPRFSGLRERLEHGAELDQLLDRLLTSEPASAGATQSEPWEGLPPSLERSVYGPFSEYLGGMTSQAEGHRKSLERAKSLLEELYSDPLLDEPNRRQMKNACWVALGEVRRLTSDIGPSSSSLAEARRCLPDKALEPERMAEILDLRASLLWHEHRFTEAREAASQGIELHRALGSAESLGAALVARAVISTSAGDLEGAIEDLREALALIHGDRTAILHLSCLKILIDLETQVGHFAAAEELLYRALDLAKRLSITDISLHLRWLQGITLHGLGHSRKAQSILSEAHEKYAARGYPVHSALTAVDLILMLAESGKNAQALDATLGLVPLISTLRPHPQGAAALQRIPEALDEDEVDLETLQQIRHDLQLIRRDPAARFSGDRSAFDY